MKSGPYHLKSCFKNPDICSVLPITGLMPCCCCCVVILVVNHRSITIYISLSPPSFLCASSMTVPLLTLDSIRLTRFETIDWHQLTICFVFCGCKNESINESSINHRPKMLRSQSKERKKELLYCRTALSFSYVVNRSHLIFQYFLFPTVVLCTRIYPKILKRI